ncbi:Mrp/NBP35 family ATP-binding protein [Parapedomonas caeni]
MTSSPEPAAPSREMVLDALRTVRDPASGQDIVSAGMVAGLTIRDGHVGFMIEVDPAAARAREPLRAAAEQALRALPGVARATVVLTAERPSAEARRPTPPAAASGKGQDGSKGQGAAQVRAIVAVGSGKGGVGKSTVATNLALALAAEGLAVGLLDADIYGPSVPKLLGLTGKPETDGEMLQPMSAHGIKAMSIGSLLKDDDTAMIWRGPMATSALMQLINDVAWGPLDVLVLDLPPGTGDIQLTLAQRVKLAGAVVVSTPQDLALIDARKAIAMFAKVNVPVLGVVENMSSFLCPHCGGESHIFGHGGAARTAAELGVPFLGEVPLVMAVREGSDSGRPVVVADPASVPAQALRAIGGRVAKALAVAPKPLPTLRFTN